MIGPTPRQAEVVRLLMRGMRRGEIAAALCMSPKTVDAHLCHVRGVSDHPTIDMVIYALAHDLVPADSPLGAALDAWAARKR